MTINLEQYTELKNLEAKFNEVLSLKNKRDGLKEQITTKAAELKALSNYETSLTQEQKDQIDLCLLEIEGA